MCYGIVKEIQGITTKRLPCLQRQFLDGGQDSEDLVQSVELQCEPISAQVLEPKTEEPLLHSWTFQEELSNLPRVDGTHEVVRLGTRFLFQFLDSLWTEEME